MKLFSYGLAALLAVQCAAAAWGQIPNAPRLAIGDEDDVEVLTRGPVHEAFAETITFDPEPGVVVPKAAPDPIEELPPDQKPDGANVAWIPGYWAWDDERTDFLWVSGIWRALPPGRQWVPGYWSPTQRGSQWISGYWADAQASDVEYLPEPPATVEQGPNIAAPSPDHLWTPGCWIWQQNRYAWRPGYWTAAHQNWVWIPAHYVWSPRGYVFIDGYYDYAVARRGVLFAPVAFRSAVYSQRGYSYSPRTVINPAVFTSHLFLRPSYGHYYFGDYYSSSYSSRGFSPWFSFASSRFGYDPFYAHERWHHRNDGQWDRRLEADYGHRRDHEESRPPRTWNAQRERNARDTADGNKSFVVAAALDEFVGNKEAALRFQPVPKLEREQIGERGKEYRTSREERQKLEAEVAADASTTGSATSPPIRTAQPAKVKLPRSPFASQPIERLNQDDAPPKSSEAPQPDAKVEGKPRKRGKNADSPPQTRVEERPAPSEKDRPKFDPRPERPPVEPRTDAPKAEPKPNRPKFEPQPERPKVEPKPEPPKSGPRTEAPKVEPKPEPPKVEPKPERPKIEPKPEPPKSSPRTEAPKVEPKPEPPKPSPRPGRGPAQPRPEPPKDPR